MSTLSICNADSGAVATLWRDVCHTHPVWVHDQLGTSAESELQLFLDNLHLADYAADPDHPNDDGIFMALDDAMTYLASIPADQLDDDQSPVVAGLLAAGKSMEEIAAAFGGAVIDGHIIPEPEKIWADDGNCEVEFEGLSRADAAQEYVDGGEWGKDGGWVEVQTYRYGYEADGDWGVCVIRSHTITLAPAIPECADGCEHDWRSPHAVVGGLEENPGVQGHGGGVIVEEVCRHCGVYRITDTWAQDAATGQIIDDNVVTYRDADEESLAWIESMQNQ